MYCYLTLLIYLCFACLFPFKSELHDSVCFVHCCILGTYSSTQHMVSDKYLVNE